jgi:hypothetical protein
VGLVGSNSEAGRQPQAKMEATSTRREIDAPAEGGARVVLEATMGDMVTLT